MTDIELVERIVDGDRAGLNILVGRWEKAIYNFAFRYLGDKELARDVTQKTFIRVYKNINKLRDTKKFSSWIYQIAANLCKDELKKKGHRDTLSIDLIHENSENGHLMPNELIETKMSQPDNELNHKQIGTIIHKALKQLPEEQRVVIIMKEYQGLKFKEIAEALDESINTVKSRMYYGLNGLRKIFQKWEITGEMLSYEM
ncbi:sigma-70 family RNA polymerase sigma factor [candidate division KSB1 bacterium]|nr:sigma-70 family RNA polymerase sigma factor [candidate division KSB1 bacterium]